MKITSVELHPDGVTDVHVLSFRDPRRVNPYNVRGITGLDADNIVPKFYGASGDAVANYHNMSMPNRVMGMDIDLNPDFSLGKTYSDLRDDLYRIIASSRTGLVQVQFKNADVIVAVISGFVSKFETPHFDRNPTIKLSMDTIEPMLMAPNLVVLAGAGIIADDIPEPPTPKHHKIVHINDPLSTAPHGFKFQLTVVAPFGSLVVRQDPAIFTVNPAAPGFLLGDVIHFSSIMNQKELYISRAVGGGDPDLIIGLADKIQTGSFWPIMFPKMNDIRFDGSEKYTIDSISYYPTYWGV